MKVNRVAGEKFTLIEREVWHGRQSRELREVRAYGHGLYKVEIDYDSFITQSSAVLKRWDGAEWKFVHSIPWREMAAVKKDMYHGSATTVDPLNTQDAERLWGFLHKIGAYMGTLMGVPDGTP